MKKLLTLTSLLLFVVHNYAQNFEWAKHFEGMTSAYGKAIIIDAAGNVISAGDFNGTVDFDPGPGTYSYSNNLNNDVYISKLDINGDFVWAKRIESTNNINVASLTLDGQENIIITGFFNGTADFDPDISTNYNVTSAGSSDFYLLKLDNSGNFLWVSTVGGNNSEQGNSVKTDAFNNIYVTGDFSSNSITLGSITLNNNSNSDLFLAKFSPTGSAIWAKAAGGSGIDIPTSIALDNNSNIYITGRFLATISFDNISLPHSGGVLFDLFVAKSDSMGNFVWAKSASGQGNDDSKSIVVDAASNVYITGFTGSTTLNFGSITIQTSALPDAFIAKYNSISGDISWVKPISGSGSESGISLEIDAMNKLYVTGDFGGSTSYSLVLGGDTLTNQNTDIFISKLDSSGNFIWSKATSGAGFENVSAIKVSNSNTIAITGSFSGTADFDPGSSVSNLTATGSSADIFVLKLSQCTPPSLSVSTTSTNLCFGDANVSATVNATGNAPFTYLWSNNQTTQTATGLPAGIHTVTVTDDSSCAAIATVTITQPAQIITNISSTATNFNSPNCNGSVSINPSGGIPPYNITWSSGTTNNLCEGWYTATITDANNCVTTDSVYVNFVVGIDEINVSGITIYPNPMCDVLNIKSEKSEIGEVKMYDVSGKVVMQLKIEDNIANVDIIEFEKGIYFIHVDNRFIKIIINR